MASRQTGAEPRGQILHAVTAPRDHGFEGSGSDYGLLNALRETNIRNHEALPADRDKEAAKNNSSVFI